MQAPHCAETRMGRLPRHGQRSFGCGSGSNSAPFTMYLAAVCAPSRTTLRETESGAPFRAICFVARLAKEINPWLRVASRISSRKTFVAPSVDLFRGSLAFVAGLTGAHVTMNHPRSGYNEKF
jgi:hypothetical protein